MEEVPTENGDKRNPDGTFAEGYKGGPGRPKGSISVISKIKAKFEENPHYFDEWIDKFLEDPRTRTAVMEAIDGKPKQSLEISIPDNLVALIKNAATEANRNPQIPGENKD